MLDERKQKPAFSVQVMVTREGEYNGKSICEGKTKRRGRISEKGGWGPEGRQHPNLVVLPKI